MQRTQTTLFASSLLGLTLAVTGCSTANSQNLNQNSDPAKRIIPKDARHADGEKMANRMDKLKDGMKHNRMAQLDLSDAQKTQLQALRQQTEVQMKQLNTTLKQYDDNIAAQKKAGASTATLLGLYQQKQAVMQQAMTLRQQQEQQFISILTPEQQLKFYENQGHKLPKFGGKEGKFDGKMGEMKPPFAGEQPPMPPAR